MQPNDQQDQTGTYHPSQSNEPHPDQQLGHEEAIAYARAKLQAILDQQQAQTQPVHQAPTQPHYYQQPMSHGQQHHIQPPQQAYQPTPPQQPPATTDYTHPSYDNPPTYHQDQTEQPQDTISSDSTTEDQTYNPSPTQTFYPTPSHSTYQTPGTYTPTDQYMQEAYIQDEMQPANDHITPDHQLGPPQKEPILPPGNNPESKVGDAYPKFQTAQISGLSTQASHAEQAVDINHGAKDNLVIPDQRLHDPRPKTRKEQIKHHSKVAKVIAAKANKSFFSPFIKSVIISVIVFLIYNAPLVMGQVYYYITPASNDSAPIIVDPSETTVSADPRIIISKLNIDVPAVYDEKSYDEKKIQTALERGIVHYGTTAMPGEDGNTVFLGHSSNSPWAPGKYKTAFSLLRKLQVNDTFVLHYQKKRYIYQVYQRKVIEPTDFSVISQDVDEPIATLITCDPPGANWKRLVIHARQISPDPSANTPHQGETITTPQDSSIPGSPPSLWDRITSIF